MSGNPRVRAAKKPGPSAIQQRDGTSSNQVKTVKVNKTVCLRTDSSYNGFQIAGSKDGKKKIWHSNSQFRKVEQSQVCDQQSFFLYYSAVFLYLSVYIMEVEHPVSEDPVARKARLAALRAALAEEGSDSDSDDSGDSSSDGDSDADPGSKRAKTGEGIDSADDSDAGDDVGCAGVEYCFLIYLCAVGWLDLPTSSCPFPVS
jgi:hypothetical protein